MTLFRRIHAETGVTIALVTHTKQLVAYGTRRIAMASGELAGGVRAEASVRGAVPDAFT
jgi:ABC-type lipoprotein export system ATPase subunit